MKTFAGNALALLTSLCLLLSSVDSSARLTASVDRSDIAMGETLRLVIAGDAGERPDEVSLSALERNFDILKRSSATSARLINGDQSVTRTLELELAPKSVGLATIPSFTVDGRTSTPIAVKVSPARAIDAGDALVLFDARVDRASVYVQAQLLLTLTLQQAINLDQREVTPLTIPGADVEALEQRTFQRQINGRLWQVIELRYAIFPQESGVLEIPQLTFSGREILPGRSLLGARLGRSVVINSEKMTIEVKPVPDTFPGSVWLPARALEISESWSKPPDSLNLGDSSTRTLQIVATGLQGAQLPPIQSNDEGSRFPGVRFYPGQESIEQTETPQGLTGQRTQSEALVPSAPGTWELPERVLPWWNTETDSLAYATVPSRMLSVAGASIVPTGDLSTLPTLPSEPSRVSGTPLWLYVLAIGGWLTAICLIIAVWMARQRALPTNDTHETASSLRGALVKLQAACKQADASAARRALLQWGRLFFNAPTLPLEGLRQIGSPALIKAMDELDASLYSATESEWTGHALFTAARDHPRVTVNAQAPVELSLYGNTTSTV